MFKTLRSRLIVFALASSLVPVTALSVFTYRQASRRITQDRTSLFLEQLAQDTADKIVLHLQEKQQDVLDIATNPWLIEALEEGEDRITSPEFERGKLEKTVGRRIQEFPDELPWFERANTGLPGFRDWYRSPLARQIHTHEGEDVSRSYHLAFAFPIISPRTRKVIGVWCNIMHWEFIQHVLDLVEQDLNNKGLATGYAFMFARDGDTIIAHKYRKNRMLSGGKPSAIDNYGTSLIRSHGLRALHDLVRSGARSARYQYPPGTTKISGLAKVDFENFGWTVGVGIDDADIFRPVRRSHW